MRAHAVAVILAAFFGMVPAGESYAAVGRTPGSASVSQTGSANYVIPIRTPSFGKVNLSLALVYDSQAPSGVAGPGWSISGLSSIDRCGATVAQNGVPSAVTLTLADKFCLDGKLLRLVNGTYGVAGSTYRTELNEFTKIEAWGSYGNGPSGFTVTTKEGVTYSYGSIYGQSPAGAQVVAAGATTPHSWKIESIADPNSAPVLFEYLGGTVQRIHYGGQSPNTLFTTFYPYSVIFEYGVAAIQDQTSHYIAGHPFSQTRRLNKIGVLSQPTVVHDVYAAEGESWEYRLNYSVSPSTSRARLTSVTECAVASTPDCLAPTTITYQDGQAGFATSLLSAGTGATSGNVYSADVDGDGKKDMVFTRQVGSSYQWWVQRAAGGVPTYTGVAIADIGVSSNLNILLDDFLATGEAQILAPVNGVWHLYRWNGSSFSVVSTGLALDSAPGAIGASSVGGRYASADINGDGLPDIVWIGGARLNNSTTGTISFASTVTPSPSYAAMYASNEEFLPSTPVGIYGNNSIPNVDLSSMDFDGDGREDLLAVFLEHNMAFSEWSFYKMGQVLSANVKHVSNRWVWELGALDHTFTKYPSFMGLPGAFNDDACTDLSGGGRMVPSACNGNVAPYTSGPVSADAIMDVDGDGRSDFLYASGGMLYWHRSLGSGVSGAISTGVSVPAGNWVVTDLDGDGLADLGVAVSSNSNQVSVALHAAAGQQPDVMKTARDGYGVGVTFDYVSTAQGSYSRVWSGVPAATHPLKDVTEPVYVVSQMATQDSGNTIQNIFSYGSAREILEGRGFAGFAVRRTQDVRNGVTSHYTVERYKQEFPNTGMLLSAQVYRADLSTLVSSTTNKLTSTLVGGAHNESHFPHVEESITTVYEVAQPGNPKNGAPISLATNTYSYDSYGNATVVTEKLKDIDVTSLWYGNEWTTTTTHTLSYDVASWCLSLPTRTTVSKILGDASQVSTTDYVIDSAKCRVTRQTIEPSNAPLTVATDLSMNSCGGIQSVQVTGRSSNGTALAPRLTTNTPVGATFESGECYLPVTTTNALGQSSQTDYRFHLGVKKSETDANGITVSWSHDRFGKTTRESRSDGTATDWAYTACSVANSYCGSSLTDVQLLVEQIERDTANVEIRRTKSYMDGYERVRRVESQTATGAWSKVDTTYDASGRIHTVTNPYTVGSTGYTRFSYDVIGRPISTELVTAGGAMDRQSSVQYEGREVKYYDAKNHLTKKKYDVAGELRRVEDPFPGGLTSYDYTYLNNNRIDTITDPQNNPSIVTTNVRGFKIAQTDVNMGSWEYKYNSLGELEEQKDEKDQITYFYYDALGRVTQRTENEGSSYWSWGTSAPNKNIGRLTAVSSPGYAESHAYDSLGRPSSVTYNYGADGSYTFNYDYNNLGMLNTLTYPVTEIDASRLRVQNVYTYGHLTQVKQYGGNPFWTLLSTDERNLPIDESLGNGVKVITDFDPLTGEMRYRQSGTQGSITNLHDLAYLWDKNGNLEQRRWIGQATETFQYDALNRMYQSVVTGQPAVTIGYDTIGNITNRTDVGGNATWIYHPTQKHAVLSAGPNSYQYDANGNMTSRNGSPVIWTSYNYPRQIYQGSNYSEIYYGANRNRWKQEANYGGATENTIYAGGLLEKVSVGNGRIYRHYINAGSSKVIYTRSTALPNQPSIAYVTSDHLGSSSAITDATGNIVVRESFESFGKRRDGSDWVGPLSSGDWTAISNTTRHGFTGHEHLDNLTLIHMNGRVYDPTIGRFMSADPYVTDPTFSQSLNRYSYVWNNPLSMTDPNGFDPCHGRSFRCDTATTGSYIPGVIVPYSSMNGIDAEFLRRRSDFVSIGAASSNTSSSASTSRSAVAGSQVGTSAVSTDITINRLDEVIVSSDKYAYLSHCGDYCSIQLGSFMSGERSLQDAMNEHWRDVATAAEVGAAVATGAAGAFRFYAARGTATTIKTSAHGATRIAGAAATRGGVLTAEQIVATRAGGVAYQSAANGTTVRVMEIAAGRYNVVVDGEKGLVTTLNNIPYKELVRSACNYGWFCAL